MIVAQLSSENVKITVAEGEASGTILAVAQKEKASLVIMGSHRMKGLNKLLFSDTAARVLKHSKLPLLTIPTNN
jgi:nucleotide-binding universal stress UspA family protein